MKNSLRPFRLWAAVATTLLLFGSMGFQSQMQAGRAGKIAGNEQEGLTSSEFSRLAREFSEPEGSFPSDNFVSNETSYLHVVDKLRELNVSGGAYIGVGPEQNFTYIAKIRPRIAFIVDLRRQAMIQHLLYKAIFDQARTRAEFLSLLLSRPLPAGTVTFTGSIEEMVEYFQHTDAPDELYAQNLARVRKIIQQEFQVPLGDQDEAGLEYCYAAFRSNGLAISYGSGNNGWPGGYGRYPKLAEILLQADPEGKPGNFLANDDDYRFIRHMQKENRIIPIVGDFAGAKALTSISRYLVRNGYTVSAFYTSNVEQYLFQNDKFGDFVENIYRLPVNENSVFIRAVPELDQVHPAHVQGFPTTTILQQISVFLDDQESYFYESYWDLVTRHYIGGLGQTDAPGKVKIGLGSPGTRASRAPNP